MLCTHHTGGRVRQLQLTLPAAAADEQDGSVRQRAHIQPCKRPVLATWLSGV